MPLPDRCDLCSFFLALGEHRRCTHHRSQTANGIVSGISHSRCDRAALGLAQPSCSSSVIVWPFRCRLKPHSEWPKREAGYSAETGPPTDSDKLRAASRGCGVARNSWWVRLSHLSDPHSTVSVFPASSTRPITDGYRFMRSHERAQTITPDDGSQRPSERVVGWRNDALRPLCVLMHVKSSSRHRW